MAAFKADRFEMGYGFFCISTFLTHLNNMVNIRNHDLNKGTYEQYRIFIGDRGLGGNQVKPPEILRQPELISFFLAHVRR